MTNDYIRRQDVIDKINERQIKLIYCFGFENDAVKIMDIAKSIVITIPSAQSELESVDVVPVVHGKWMKEDRGHVEYCAVCDQCGFDWMWSDRGYFKFCPNCGAKMDGGES